MLLILTLVTPGAPPASAPVGVMVDEHACQLAGAAMEVAMEAAHPGADITWTCLPVAGGMSS